MLDADLDTQLQRLLAEYGENDEYLNILVQELLIPEQKPAKV